MANGYVEGIPSIDISAFTGDGNTEERGSIANDLAHLSSLHGCIAIRGHGLSQDALDEAFAHMKDFFDLSYADKMKAPRPDGAIPNRGYVGVGRENVAEKTSLVADDGSEKEKLQMITDYKEFVEIGAEDNPEQQNIWLPEDILPSFRPFVNRFFQEVNTAALNIMEALIIGLHLSPDEAEAMRQTHPGKYSELRLSHYPPVSAEQLKTTDIYRIAAHTDFSLFTILFQKDQGGLEFENRITGEWMPATPRSGHLYMNIGDLFERFSNGRLPSSKHRVVPPKSQTGHESIPSRYSIPFFVAPKSDATITPLASLVATDGKSRYDPVIFKEYATQVKLAQKVEVQTYRFPFRCPMIGHDLSEIVEDGCATAKVADEISMTIQIPTLRRSYWLLLVLAVNPLLAFLCVFLKLFIWSSSPIENDSTTISLVKTALKQNALTITPIETVNFPTNMFTHVELQ